MTPTHANKAGARYRYYVSRALAEGRAGEAGSVTRVPAHDVEQIVMEAVRASFTTNVGGQNADGPDPLEGWNPEDQVGTEQLQKLIDRIVISRTTITIEWSSSSDTDEAAMPTTIAWTKPSSRRRRETIAASDPSLVNQRAIKVEVQAGILDALIKGRRWHNEIVSGVSIDIGGIAVREGRSERSISQMMSLVFLAPDITKAIVDGTLPRGIGLSRMTELPMLWSEQRAALGLADPA